MDKKCTDLHIANIAKFLPRWKAVAKLLGLEGQIVNDIEGHYRNPEDQRSEALMRWVGQAGAQATYKKLYNVLCDLEENDTAEKVKKLAGDAPENPPPANDGVCDRADGSKSKEWQYTAAKAAASYIKQRLMISGIYKSNGWLPSYLKPFVRRLPQNWKDRKMQLILAVVICLIGIISLSYDNLILSTLWSAASSHFWIFFSTYACSPSSGGMGCCPVMDNSSIIETLPDYHVNVDIIVDFGTCSKTQDGGFQWHVSWGDGVKMSTQSDDLGIFQSTYQYKQAGTYSFTVKYCSSPSTNGQPCCLVVHRRISVAS